MTNHRPFVKGSDDGIWRRLNIIGFNAKIADDDKDPHFREEKLRPEFPGILAWMIKGCFKCGSEDGLKPSAAVTQATKAYRSEMDFIQQWLDERTVADPKGAITPATWRMAITNAGRSRSSADARQPSVRRGAPRAGLPHDEEQRRPAVQGIEAAIAGRSTPRRRRDDRQSAMTMAPLPRGWSGQIGQIRRCFGYFFLKWSS